MKCLIADDDGVSRYILNVLLSPYFDCEMVANGAEAITYFTLAHDNNYPYDLLCIDIMMPECDGIEALKQIRQYEKKLELPSELNAKVLMITASEFPDSIKDTVFECGVVSYIEKPFSKQLLFEELQLFGFISDF
jgi:two-component system chemotaxis response regulator CheY